MKNFEYFAPTTIQEAISLLSAPDKSVLPLAGGTDLIAQLKEGARSVDRVVDVKRIAELTEIRLTPDGGLSIGAAVSCSRLQENDVVIAQYPGLADVVRIIGAWQIQNRATLGGNLCNSSPAADSIPILMAYDATCRIDGPKGTRTIAVGEFCTGPGKNVLSQGELVSAIVLPSQGPNTGSAYERFIPRNEMDIAVVGAGAWLRLSPQQDRILEARVALGAVAPRPIFAVKTCDQLANAPAAAAAIEAAAAYADDATSPISDMRGDADYRRHLAKVLTKRALLTALARARSHN